MVLFCIKLFVIKLFTGPTITILTFASTKKRGNLKMKQFINRSLLCLLGVRGLPDRQERSREGKTKTNTAFYSFERYLSLKIVVGLKYIHI